MGIKSNMIKRVSHSLRERNISISKEYPSDLSPQTVATVKYVRPYTMTTVQRIEAVISATRYVVDNDIPGAFVESGVWMGGSIMAAARTLLELGVTDRDLYLYDTFEGLPAPGKHDRVTGSDQSAADLFAQLNKKAGSTPFLDAPETAVRANLARTGYPMERVHTIAGMVEDTIPVNSPDQIAFLRLDTDWYNSTRVELENLYPKLTPSGVLIIDDYGYLDGPRKAVDEYFADRSEPIFLHRIDSSGRLAIKPGALAR